MKGIAHAGPPADGYGRAGALLRGYPPCGIFLQLFAVADIVTRAHSRSICKPIRRFSILRSPGLPRLVRSGTASS